MLWIACASTRIPILLPTLILLSSLPHCLLIRELISNSPYKKIRWQNSRGHSLKRVYAYENRLDGSDGDQGLGLMVSDNIVYFPAHGDAMGKDLYLAHVDMNTGKGYLRRPLPYLTFKRSWAFLGHPDGKRFAYVFAAAETLRVAIGEEKGWVISPTPLPGEWAATPVGIFWETETLTVVLAPLIGEAKEGMVRLIKVNNGRINLEKISPAILCGGVEPCDLKYAYRGRDGGPLFAVIKKGKGLRIVDKRGVILSRGPAKADAISFFDLAKLGILANYAVPDFVVGVNGRALPYRGLPGGTVILNRYNLQSGVPERILAVRLSGSNILYGAGRATLLVEGEGLPGKTARRFRVHRGKEISGDEYRKTKPIEPVPSGCGLPDAIWKRKSGGYRVFSRSGCYMHLKDDLRPANN